jgi:hypothetical protein
VNEVTRILQAVERGEGKAAQELLPLVYEELRRLAAFKMSQQPADQTLQPTALVHEAYLKLLGDGNHSWNDRRHFFALDFMWIGVITMPDFIFAYGSLEATSLRGSTFKPRGICHRHRPNES